MSRILLFENSEASLKSIIIGEKRLFKAKGKSICVARTKAGVIAFENECPHLGESLAKGNINPFNEITCPWHSYRFNLTNGEEVENRCSGLKFISLIQEDDKLYLEF